MDESLQGRLLVASPHLFDPNFARRVVLVLEHNDEGALGIVLNDPTATDVEEIFPQWAEAVASPAVVFSGGPVQRDAAVALVAPGGGDPAPKPVLPWLGSIDLSADPLEVLPGVSQLRIFVGYAGWSTGQLEEEMEDGGWIVVDAMPGDVFDAEPEELWRKVLRRQPGNLRIIANFPQVPSLN